MSALDEPSTINGWVQQPGPIHLRRAPERRRDPPSGEGVILAAISGFAFFVWAIVVVELVLR